MLPTLKFWQDTVGGWSVELCRETMGARWYHILARSDSLAPRYHWGSFPTEDEARKRAEAVVELFRFARKAVRS